ncbi:MAG: WG repeat-containing protein [Saprospiraceae bacterium]|nr:WG repeat-containing protein [Saprospiraceae bacterium]
MNCPDDKGNWGFIDINGNVIIEFKYKLTRPFLKGKELLHQKKTKTESQTEKTNMVL